VFGNLFTEQRVLFYLALGHFASQEEELGAFHNPVDKPVSSLYGARGLSWFAESPNSGIKSKQRSEEGGINPEEERGIERKKDRRVRSRRARQTSKGRWRTATRGGGEERSGMGD
jgi:hypothetical protein